MLAISNGFLECVLALLPKSDATVVDRNGRGLMHRACSLRNELLCKQLMEKNADFLASDCNKVTPLHIASRIGNCAFELCNLCIFWKKRKSFVAHRLVFFLRYFD